MLVPSGAKSRPPCVSKLCGPVPKYEFREEEGRGGAGRGFSTHVGGSNGVNTRPLPPTLPKQQQPYLDPRSFLKPGH